MGQRSGSRANTAIALRSCGRDEGFGTFAGWNGSTGERRLHYLVGMTLQISKNQYVSSPRFAPQTIYLIIQEELSHSSIAVTVLQNLADGYAPARGIRVAVKELAGSVAVKDYREITYWLGASHWMTVVSGSVGFSSGH